MAVLTTALRSKVALSVLALASGSAAFAQGNCVINGGVNNGIQIQNCPVIENAPTPTFHVVREDPVKKNDDGSYTRSILISVDAPYVPNNMVVVAYGPTVTDLTVSNGGMMFGGKSTESNQHVYGVYEPAGRYTITVKTSDETPASIQIAFNAPNINWGGHPPVRQPPH
jgi:hypothetical protein